MSKVNEEIIHNFNELFESGVEEAFQQSIFDFFPGIIYVYDLDPGRLRYINKKVSEVLGFTSKDLNEWDHDLMKLVYEEDADLVRSELEKYADLEDEVSHSYQCRFNRKSGGWIHVEVTGKVIKRNAIGKPSSLLFIAQDISSRVKEAEELRVIITQIREKEELLADFKERVDVKDEFLECGSWKISLGDKVITWSDGMYRLFGYNPQRDKGSIVVNEDLYRSHMRDGDFEKAIQFRNQLLSNENNYERAYDEYEITTRGGEKKHVETFAKIIRDSKGNPKRMLGTTHNITRLRNFEKEREQNISKLKTSVTNLEEFTYLASHDMQEPLRKIATFSERMKAKFASDLNDEAKDYLDRILKTSKNAHLLIDGLMGFLQLDHQQQRFIKTDLNTLLDEVKEELELRIEESEATIISKNLPMLEVIPQQLKQLLVNLVSNSFKFRKPDQLLVISVDARKSTPAEVESHHLVPGANYVEMTIKDNGVGFAAATTGKMFQMFQRFHNKSTYPGAGIGLAICRKIVDKHHGLITAVGVPGEGATFRVILPVKQIKENEVR